MLESRCPERAILQRRKAARGHYHLRHSLFPLSLSTCQRFLDSYYLQPLWTPSVIGFGCRAVTADGKRPEDCCQTEDPSDSEQKWHQRRGTFRECTHGLDRRPQRLKV